MSSLPPRVELCNSGKHCNSQGDHKSGWREPLLPRLALFRHHGAFSSDRGTRNVRYAQRPHNIERFSIPKAHSIYSIPRSVASAFHFRVMYIQGLVRGSLEAVRILPNAAKTTPTDAPQTPSSKTFSRTHATIVKATGT